MAEVRWTEAASEWLEEIFRFIAKDNPEAARKVVDGIYQKAQSLADFPAMGHAYRREPEGQIRMLLYGSYRIAYIHKEKDDMMEILGVYHGALDIGRYL